MNRKIMYQLKVQKYYYCSKLYVILESKLMSNDRFIKLLWLPKAKLVCATWHQPVYFWSNCILMVITLFVFYQSQFYYLVLMFTQPYKVIKYIKCKLIFIPVCIFVFHLNTDWNSGFFELNYITFQIKYWKYIYSKSIVFVKKNHVWILIALLNISFHSLCRI